MKIRLFYMSCSVKSYNGKTEGAQFIFLIVYFFVGVGWGRHLLWNQSLEDLGVVGAEGINMAGTVHRVYPAVPLNSLLGLSIWADSV